MNYQGKERDYVFEDILEEICSGRALRNVLRDTNMPSPGSFYVWLDEDTGEGKEEGYETYAERYARACEIRAEGLLDELIDIADDSSEDVRITDKGNEAENREFINRSKVRIETRKYLIEKMHPKKYGTQKIDVTSKGEKLETPAITWTVIDAKKQNG